MPDFNTCSEPCAYPTRTVSQAIDKIRSHELYSSDGNDARNRSRSTATSRSSSGASRLRHVTRPGKNAVPCDYDDGNVIALIDADANTEIPAICDYDAFGTLVRASGPSGKVNTLHLTTKHSHEYRSVSFYGFRFYSPGQGRFLNRDPINEAGGLNLYGFVGNDPVNAWDYLGLSWNTAGHKPEQRGNRRQRLPDLDLNLNFTKGFEVKGSAGSPVAVSITGRVGVNVGYCCKDDGTKRRMFEMNGRLTAGVGTPGLRWTVRNDIAAVEVDFGLPDCPTATKPKIGGIIVVGASATLKNLSAGVSCSYSFPSGKFSCGAGVSATSAGAGIGGDVQGGITIKGRFIDE